MKKKIFLYLFSILPVLYATAQNVGIGTATPAYKLDVAGNTRFTGDHILTNNGIGGTWFYLVNTSATPTGWKLITSGSASGVSQGSFMMYNDNNQAQFTVQQTGNAGIGTASPMSRLHVLSSAPTIALFESPSTVGTWIGLKNTSADGTEWNIISTGSANAGGAGKLLFYNLGNVMMTFNNTGHVGITGTLEVQSGRYYYNDRYFRTVFYNESNGTPNGIGITPQLNNFGGLGTGSYYWDDANITEIFYNDLFDVSDERAKMNIRPLETVLD